MSGTVLSIKEKREKTLKHHRISNKADLLSWIPSKETEEKRKII